MAPTKQEQDARAALEGWGRARCALLGIVDVRLVAAQQLPPNATRTLGDAAAGGQATLAARRSAASAAAGQHLWLADPFASAVKVSCRQRDSNTAPADSGNGRIGSTAGFPALTVDSNGNMGSQASSASRAQAILQLRSSLEACTAAPAVQQPQADGGVAGGNVELLFLTPEAVRLSLVELDAQQRETAVSGQEAAIKLWPPPPSTTITDGTSSAGASMGITNSSSSNSSSSSSSRSSRLSLPTGARLRLVAELVNAAGDVVLGEKASWNLSRGGGLGHARMPEQTCLAWPRGDKQSVMYPFMRAHNYSRRYPAATHHVFLREGYPPVMLRLTLEPAAWVRLQPQVDAVTDQGTGQAQWSQVVVHGWPGDSYTLRVEAVGITGTGAAGASGGDDATSQLLAAAVLPVTLLPCAQGEEIDNGASALAPPLTSW